MLTIPIFFLKSSKRPIFTASLGMMIWMFLCLLAYTEVFWLPEMFKKINMPVLVTTAISAVVFILFAYFLFERHRENTLAAALYALLCVKEPSANAPEAETIPPAEPASAAMLEAGFTQEEKDVALLLMEGYTQYEISRKLHLLSADVGKQIKTIREKVSGADNTDPVIAAASKEYALTKRETDVLQYLRRRLTNAEIAADLSLSEETIKVHVHNILKKIPVETRSEISEWLETFEVKE